MEQWHDCKEHGRVEGSKCHKCMPLGRKVLIYACNWCDNKWERDDLDPDDYDDLDEIVYEDDVGCPLCRQKEHGFTPYITYQHD